MTTKVEKVENSTATVSVAATKSEWEAAQAKAFQKVKANLKLKGFRSGTAIPDGLAKSHINQQEVYNEAINVILPDLYEAALKENDYVPFLQPTVNVTKLSDTDIEVVFEIPLYPEVTLGEYKGIKVAALDNNVTEAEIANEKNRLLKDKIVIEVKEEQVIALGDIAVFDFLGSVDGVPFDGGAAENYELEIGSGQFIPGFEDQMVGMEANTEKDITVTFPENYGAPNLAGKEAVFHITLHEVKAKNTPELTDELVAELKIENVNTVEEFNAHVESSLAERKLAYNTRQIDNTVMETVMNNATVDLPRSFVADRVKSLRAQVENQAKQYNIPFEMFLQFSGVSVEQFEAQCQEEAERQVKSELVLDKIAEVEGLLPTDEQIDEAIKNYSLSSKISVNDILKRIGKGPFAAQIASNNAIQLILDSKVVE